METGPPQTADAGTALLEAVARDRRNLPALLAQAETSFAAGLHNAAVTLLKAANELAPG